MVKYSVMRVIRQKRPFSKKVFLKTEPVYPYSMSNLGHAKACARMVNSSVNYTDLHNKVVNIIVQESLHGDIVFAARKHVNGIYGREYDKLEQ